MPTVIILGVLGLVFAAIVISAAFRMFQGAFPSRDAGAVDRPTIRSLLRESLDESTTEAILPLTQPSVLLRPLSIPPRTLPPGKSHIGGEPDLPEGKQWPLFEGRPMSFLAQINCAEVIVTGAAGQLPPVGWLNFFYDSEQGTRGSGPADRASWVVLYFPIDAQLRPAAFPDDLPDEARFDLHEVSFQDDLTLPPWDSPEVNALDLPGETLDAYLEALEQLPCRQRPTITRMLGHPECLRGGRMGLQCQLAANGINVGDPSGYQDPRAEDLAAGASDWVLLLQLDSVGEMMWGDAGRVYFYIRRQDLADRRFENAWMILQSG